MKFSDLGLDLAPAKFSFFFQRFGIMAFFFFLITLVLLQLYGSLRHDQVLTIYLKAWNSCTPMVIACTINRKNKIQPM